MKRTNVLSFFCWLLFVSASCNIVQPVDVEETSESKEHEINQNELLGGINAGESSDISAALKEVIESGAWERFTPAPIIKSDCHVEVQVVQKIPGRCIRLGKHRVPACQTQNWVSFNSEECELN